jgi:hypothetical protein
LKGEQDVKKCDLGWASDFHHGVEEKWFVVFDARRFFGQPRRNLWMGMPTTKGDFFFFLAELLSWFCYTHALGGKRRLLFFVVLLPKDQRGKDAI